MIISIPKKYGEDFTQALSAKFIRDIKLKLLITDFRILDMWMQVEFGLPNNITCKDIILFGLKNLKIVTNQSNYNIVFNDIIVYPGTSTRLITLLKTINYGNRYFKGNPIIVDECKQLNTDMSNLYRNYSFMGVVL